MRLQDIPQRLLLLALASFAVGLFASISTGVPRVLFEALLVAAAGAAAWLLERAPGDRPDVLGGAGYRAPPTAWVRWMHVTITVLYSVGIMVVVFAALVRTRTIDVDIAPTMVQTFPLFVGIYLLLLGVTAQQQVRHRPIVHDWTTRLHAWATAALVGVTLVASLVLASRGHFATPGGVLLQSSDLPVLVLVTTLMAGTHILLTVGLPTSVDLVVQLVERKRGPSASATQTPPIVYAVILAVALAMVLSFIASQLDIFERIGRFRDDRAVYIIAVVPLSLIVFFLASAWVIWREGRRGLYKRRISTKLRNDLLVYGLSALGGLIGLVGLSLVLNGEVTHLPLLGSGRDVAKDLTALTILATTGPIGWYLHRQHQRVDAVEVRLPDFLNDLAESRRAGLTLAASLRVAASTDYGALTGEVRKMANQVAWGISFNEALEQFSHRVPTALVRRTTQLVVEASHTGGSISEILKAAARDAFELKNIEAERRVTMMTYLIVIYVVFFVFMVVLAALDTQFIPAVIEAQQKMEGSTLEGGLGGGGARLDSDEIRFVYFNAAMVQAMGNGIVGGVLGEGRVTAGFRHVAIMAFSAWVVFRLVLAAV